MTTPNGGRIVEHVDGLVASSNERGCKLVGEDAYRNFSKYAEPPIAAPARGSSVRLGLDASGFVRTVEILSGAASSSTRDRTISRLAVLKAAANFTGLWGQARPEIKSDHVLALADRWLAWEVTRPTNEPNLTHDGRGVSSTSAVHSPNPRGVKTNAFQCYR